MALSARRSSRYSSVTLGALTGLVGALGLLVAAAWAETAPVEEKRLQGRLGSVRLPFIANRGQIDPAVAYYAPTFAGTVYVNREGQIVYALPGRSDPRSEPEKRRSGKARTPASARSFGRAPPRGSSAGGSEIVMVARLPMDG